MLKRLIDLRVQPQGTGTMRIKRENSQLLIVDMQKILLDLMEDKDRVVERAKRLVIAAEHLEIPTLFSEQYPEKLGPTIDELKEAADEDSRAVGKMEFSCMGNEVLSEQLHFHRKKGLGQVVLCGLEAHICVLQTVMDLEDQGFEVFVAADSVTSRDETSWDLALDRMSRSGAEIVDSEMVIFEWLEKAGTPEFKELQPLVK